MTIQLDCLKNVGRGDTAEQEVNTDDWRWRIGEGDGRRATREGERRRVRGERREVRVRMYLRHNTFNS